MTTIPSAATLTPNEVLFKFAGVFYTQTMLEDLDHEDFTWLIETAIDSAANFVDRYQAGLLPNITPARYSEISRADAARNETLTKEEERRQDAARREKLSVGSIW